MHELHPERDKSVLPRLYPPPRRQNFFRPLAGLALGPEHEHFAWSVRPRLLAVRERDPALLDRVPDAGVGGVCRRRRRWWKGKGR